MNFQFFTISSIVLVFLSNDCNALKCYQCKTTVGDCIDGQCQGAWCAAIITEDKTTNSLTMEKTCGQANPSGSGLDGCAKEVNGQITVQKCGCQLEEFCNSEASLTRLMNSKNGGVPGGFTNATGNAGGPFQPGGGSVPIAPFAAGPNQPFVPNNLPINPPFAGGGQVDPNNPNNTNPALPRFPPTNNNQSPNNFPPQQPSPNANANGGGQSGFIGGAGVNVINSGNGQQGVPIGGAGGGGGNTLSPAEPEPTGRNVSSWPTTTQSPNAVNGQQSANLGDVNGKSASLGDKYNCWCYGPTYCKSGNKCRGDFCSVIEFSPLDLAKSPGSPPVSSSSGPVTHSGCAGAADLPGSGLNTQRSFPVTQYEVVLQDGRRNFVKANQRVCTGDYCNSSSRMKKMSVLFSLVFTTFTLLLVR